MSEDFFFGCIRRFTPNFASEDPWNMLLTPGVTDYLLLSPDGGSRNSSSGTFTWTNQLTLARGNAARNYPEAQGVTLDGNILSFVCRSVKRLFRLNLEDMSYTMTSTVGGLFDGDPNEIKAVRGEETLLYMTEIGGRRSGLHVRTQNGEVYTVLEGYSRSHSAGFALSPDGMHMYLTFKNQGTVFDIVRDDGLSFYDELTLDGTGEARNDRTYIKPTTSDVIDVSP